MEKGFWEQKLSVGVTQFDEHHKKLIDLMLSLKFKVENKNLKISIKDILLELISYSKYHFKAEERAMKQYHYPDIENHIKEHNDFIRYIESISRDYNNGIKCDYNSIYIYLKNWLITHIMNTDRLYSDLLSIKMQ